jgi:hypothetical protein
MSLDEFIELFLSIPENYSIGIHGITSSDNHIDVANSIMNNGLILNGWGGILSSVEMFGRLKNMDDRDKKKLLNYFYGNVDSENKFVNVLFAFPQTLKDYDNKEYFLGYFKKTSGYAKGVDEAGDGLPLNRMAEADSLISKEFIVGYIIKKCDSNYFEFVKNDSFIGFMNDGKQKEFFEGIKDRLVNDYSVVDKEEVNRVVSFFKESGVQLPEYFKQANRYFDDSILIK